MGQQIFTSERLVVVIVDDDLAVRTLARVLARDRGHRGARLCERRGAAEEVPDAGCFVIDYKLPGMNGLDLLAELRRRKVATPAILITTHPSAAVRQRAAATGAALIEKPLLGDALFREIRAALAGARITNAAGSSTGSVHRRRRIRQTRWPRARPPHAAAAGGGRERRRTRGTSAAASTAA